MGKDIPIIFSAPMVRALLEGRKTMTRRLLYSKRKGNWPGPALKDADVFDGYRPPPDGRGWHWHLTGWERTLIDDRLWVRERAWFDKNVIPAVGCARCFFEGGEVRFADGRSGVTPGSPACASEEMLNLNSSLKLRPSIHLPRWASRVTLAVTAVKVERLNDISEADCFAEGVTGEIVTEATGERKPFGPAALMNYGALWERLHGEGSWLANPFVVAVSFRVVRANIDAPEAKAAA